MRKFVSNYVDVYQEIYNISRSNNNHLSLPGSTISFLGDSSITLHILNLLRGSLWFKNSVYRPWAEKRVYANSAL